MPLYVPAYVHWDRHAAPQPAPLPTYQRRYPQERARQQGIRAENSGCQPREPVSRQAYELPDRSPSLQQSRPVQQAEPRPAPGYASPALPPTQPRPRLNSEQPMPQQDRPQAAPTSHVPRQHAGRRLIRPAAPAEHRDVHTGLQRSDARQFDSDGLSIHRDGRVQRMNSMK